MDPTNFDEDDLGIGVPLIESKYQKLQITQHTFQLPMKTIRSTEINPHIDPRNQAVPLHLDLEPIAQTTFNHYMLTNKFQAQRKQIFQKLRTALHLRGISAPNRVSEKLESQTMVVRFVLKHTTDTMRIEDEYNHADIFIPKGIVWVGLLCCIQTTYSDNMYKLTRIIDFSTPLLPIPQCLTTPFSAYRILLLKGPFSTNESKQTIGINILIRQLQRLKKQNTRIQCIVLFGPILSTNNKLVKKGNFDTTLEEQYHKIIESICYNVRLFSKLIQIVVVPSPQDVVSMYPIPQLPIECGYRQARLHYLSNPGRLQLKGSGRKYTFDLINYDVLNYIDENRAGYTLMGLLQQNLQTYFKQPFLISNTIDQPFDQVNINQLYNGGEFADVVIITSQKNPPFAREIKGKLFVNIGSLGIDYHFTEKHYINIVSVYAGQGYASRTIKVQSLTI